MKKRYASRLIISLFLSLFMFPIAFPAVCQAKVKAPKKDCFSYVVMDAGSGKVLFGQDGNKMIYPASTAKLMTAIVCIEQGNVDSMIRTKDEVVNGTTPGAYAVGLPSGVKFSFEDLLNLSLIASAADATDSLAVEVFGSKKACAEAMNKKCKELGLHHTSFDNPVGNDIGAGYNETYATAREMALITRYAMSVPLIREIVAKSGYSTRYGADININTTNWFIRGTIPYDTDRYKVIGSKSGTTNAAGNVFIATAMDWEGHEVICAYFGNVSKESTFRSIRSLLDYTFKKYRKGKLKLTKSGYDVRCDKEAGEIYTEYASAGCFPERKSGRFMPNMLVKRKQLARMMRTIDNMKDNKSLSCFVSANVTGKVTSADLADLTALLYPHLNVSRKRRDDILSKCAGTEDMTDREKDAFAAYIDAGLVPDNQCKNASRFISRKEALIYADRIKDLELFYTLKHPKEPADVIDENGYIRFSVPDLNKELKKYNDPEEFKPDSKKPAEEVNKTETDKKEETATEADKKEETATGAGKKEETATEAKQ